MVGSKFMATRMFLIKPKSFKKKNENIEVQELVVIVALIYVEKR